MATQQFTGSQGNGSEKTRHDAKTSVDKAAGSYDDDALQNTSIDANEEGSDEDDHSDNRENTEGDINERLPKSV